MKELFEKLNINPKNESIYKRAFSHSSYVNENNLKADYERLEFLGDAVLDLIMSDYLYRNIDAKEGDMTKLRASYVCENALYKYSKDLNLSKYIKVGHGEEIDGGRYKKVILADTFEALIGAIYIDLGYETVKRVIHTVIIPYIEDKQTIFFSDYKSALQEYVQTTQKSLSYHLVDEQGPSHNKVFTMEVRIDNIVYGKGSAQSKKEAEQEAAHDAIKRLPKFKS